MVLKQTVLLLSLLTFSYGWNQQLVLTWTQNVSTVIDSFVQNYMRFSEMQNYYDEVARQGLYQQVTFSQDYFNNITSKLSSVLVAKTTLVKNLQTKVEQAYLNRGNEGTNCQYYNADDANNMPTLRYDSRFNLNISYQASVMKFPPNPDLTSTKLKEAICFSRQLDSVFVAQSEIALFQYFASIQGGMRLYPAQYWTVNYDARFQSWYVAASSGPKNVLLIIDTSGSMDSYNRINNAKAAAVAVLESLTASDWVNIVSFDTYAVTPSCFPNKLVRATTENVKALNDYINALYAGAATNYDAAFTTAFNMIDATNLDPLAGSGCETVILFLTDGEATVGSPDPTNLIRSRNTGFKKVKVFTFALGSSVATGSAILKSVACSNEGLAFSINDGEDIAAKMRTYYQYFAAGISSSVTAWSLPYVDDPEIGLVITAALPAYDRTTSPPTLIGVVGIDIPVTELLQGVVSEENEGASSYAFLVNRYGEVYAHPSLPRPNTITATPLYYDISDLEYANLTSMRQGITSGNSGFYGPITARRLIPTGELSSEGGRFVDFSVSYYWNPIPNTPFTIGYALSDQDKVFRTITGFPVIQQTDQVTTFYHQVPLYPEPYKTALNASTLPPNHPTHPNATVSYSHSGIKIGPIGFIDGYKYLSRDETSNDVGIMHRQLNFISLPGDNPPQLQDQILKQVVITSQIENIWKQNFPSNAVWVYVASRGISRDFPASALYKSYDPSLRPWYKKGFAFAGSNAIASPYFDEGGAGKIITISRAVFEGNSLGAHTPTDTVTAVMGLDFKYQDFRSLIDSVLPNCQSTGVNTRCFLIDHSATLVTHNSYVQGGNDASVWLGVRQGRLASSLITSGFISLSNFIDYEHVLTCQLYQVNQSALAAISGVYVGSDSSCGTFWIASVPNSNLFVVGFNGTLCTNAATPPSPPSCSPLVKNPCGQILRPRIATCPDFSLTANQLETLRGDNWCFNPPQTSPGNPTQSAPTSIIHTSQGIPTQNTPFSNDNQVSSSNATSGLSPGALAGIIVASIVGLVIIIGLAAFIIMRKPRVVIVASSENPPPYA